LSVYENIVSLKKYVKFKKNKNFKELEETADKWIKVSAENKLAYEVEWFGVPIIQTSEDMILMQELIFKVKPDVIVETGIAHGGSLIFYASIMELLGNGKVIGIDIDIREHNKKVIEAHPLFKRIELIEGSSVDIGVIKKINEKICKGSKVIVCLDSDHTKDHVLQELTLYNKFVTKESYLVVFDTHTSRLVELGVCDKKYRNNSPKEAIGDFLKTNKSFVIDKEYNKLFISYSLNGYLKKIK